MTTNLHKAVQDISRMMKEGKVDVEAGRDAIERLQTQIKYEQALKGANPPVRMHNPPIAQQPASSSKPTVWQKLCMRMDWDLVGAQHKYKICLIEDAGKVFVLGVRNGEHFALVDDPALFPCDQVVTQLRMLYGGD